MKHALLILFLVTVFYPAKSQIVKGECNCDVLLFEKDGYNYLPNEAKAAEIIAFMLKRIQAVSHIRFNETISVREASCPSPKALMCPKDQSKDQRLILYNNDFLNRITKKDGKLTWIDAHILAHEIGHHVLGHLEDHRKVAILQERFEQDTKGREKIMNQYRFYNSQALEIEADFFGLWLLFNVYPDFSFNGFIDNFDKEYLSELDKTRTSSSTHPPFQERHDAMRLFWRKLNEDRSRRPVASAGYFADAAGSAYMHLNKDKKIWDVSLMAGATVGGIPDFTVAGQKVDALVYHPSRESWNTNLGILVSWFKWQSQLRLESELAWSRQKYGTYSTANNNRTLLERFEVDYATIYPKVTWRPSGSRTRAVFTKWRFGLFASGGLNLRLPLGGMQYENFANPAVGKDYYKLKASVLNPRFTVGLEFLRKTYLARGYKLAFNYEWQKIALDATPRPKARSHNFDVTLYRSIYRR